MTVLFSAGIFDSFIGFDREEIALQVNDCIKSCSWAELHRAQQSGDYMAIDDYGRQWLFCITELDFINDTVLVGDIARAS